MMGDLGLILYPVEPRERGFRPKTAVGRWVPMLLCGPPFRTFAASATSEASRTNAFQPLGQLMRASGESPVSALGAFALVAEYAKQPIAQPQRNGALSAQLNFVRIRFCALQAFVLRGCGGRLALVDMSSEGEKKRPFRGAGRPQPA